MKSFITLLLITLLIGAYYGVVVYLTPLSPSNEVTPELISDRMLGSVSLFLNALGSFATWLGLVLSYILFRVTFGRRVIRFTSFAQFLIFALLPAIVFVIALAIKPPADVLTLFGDVFGKLSIIILGAIVFVFSLAIYGIFSLLIEGDSKKANA